jgi:lipopolysaccharide transport system ATP-binding protein
MNAALVVENLSKMYRVYAKPADRLKELVTGRSYHQEFWALREITFEVGRGEAVGIIGRNGAGKSTLLKILAGTLEPTLGRVMIFGKVSSLLELGTGFNPELSGHENVYLSGLVLGMSKSEIDRKYQRIVDFAELHDFMHLPVKTYSTGMYMRLAFSIAVHIDPEIFIVDEALAVGDMYFVGRCIERMKQICESGATVLLVSHNLFLVQRLCQRAIWLDHGQLKMVGPANEVCIAYENAIREEQESLSRHQEALKKSARLVVTTPSQASTHAQSAASVASPNQIWGSGEMTIVKVEMLDRHGQDRRTFIVGDHMTIRIHYRVLKPVPREPTFYILITREDGVLATRAFSDDPYINLGPFGQEGYVDIVLEPLILGQGRYFLSVGIFPHKEGAEAIVRLDPYEFHDRLYTFTVGRQGKPLMTVFDHPVRWHHVPAIGEEKR